MKKAILFTILSIFSMNSFASFSLSCPEIYKRIIDSKTLKKEKAETTGYYLNSFALSASAMGAPLVTAALSIPAIVLISYSSFTPREEKALAYAEEDSRALIRLTKKLQKKIHPDIHEQEIIELVQNGLDSGEFCMDFPDLMSPREVRKYVESQLREKYSLK
ncbi:MAG: hypothetical protein ACLGHN_12770 [Bacteriovoracia bacterium]